MAKKKQSFADLMSESQALVNGLKNNLSEVEKRGVDADFVSKLEKMREKVIALNNEQDKLKADLKEKTAEIQKELDAMVAALSEGRKVVKIAIPQVRWVEFGIADKR